MPRLPGGLQYNPHLTRAQAPSLEFEPSLGLMAARVEKFGADIRSFREPLKRSIQKVMIPSFMKNFEQEGRPEPWEPLLDETLARKDSGNKILQRTGKLRRRMSYLNTWTLTSDRAFIRDLPPSVWYGKVHQQGFDGEIISGTSDVGLLQIPARPFIVMQDDDVDEIENVFEEWIDERLRRSGIVRPYKVI